MSDVRRRRPWRAPFDGSIPRHPGLDHLDVTFDDRHAVASAGLLLGATLADRLGIEAAADELVCLDGPAGAHPGAKLLTLIHAILAGGDCIDDVDVLRCGQTASVLGHRVMAPSTVGTWLRGFTFGHTRQLDRLTEQALARAWQAGAGPGDAAMTIDVDSTIVEVCGHHKQGASYGSTKRLGYHPCWPPAPTPARCCTPGCAPAAPTPPAACPASPAS